MRIKAKHAGFLALWLWQVTWLPLFGATYYVATNGANSANGLSTGTPWRTIGYAVNRVNAGDTVYVRGGDYREYVNCTNTRGHAGGWITVQAYSNEIPTIKGSDVVTGWVQHSSAIWKKTNWANNTQQVFVDENLLQQIGWPNQYVSTNAFSCSILDFIYIPYGHSCSEINPKARPSIAINGLSELVPYSFFYDEPAKTLYICLNTGDDPNNRLVEVSSRFGLFYMWETTCYLRIEGLHFRHNDSFTTTQHGWPGVMLGNSCVMENCAVEWCDASGVAFHDNATLLRSRVSHNGMDGARVASATNVTISSCTITYNNYRDISGNFVAAIKYHPAAGGTVESNEIAWNRCAGVWFDTCDSNFPIVIRNNRIHHQRITPPGASDTETPAPGIFIEASVNADIHDNLIYSNSYEGVSISGSRSCRFYNNTVAGTYRPRGSSSWALTAALRLYNPWSGHPVTYNRIFNNVFAYNNTEFDIYSVTQNGSTVYGNLVDYNVYYRHPNAYEIVPPSMWKDNDGLIYPGASFCNAMALGGDSAGYTNLAAWTAATGWDSNSLETNPLLLIHYLPTNSPCVDRGVVSAFMNFTDDLDGNPRITGLRPDMGAYELGTLVCDFQQNAWTGVYPLKVVFTGAGAGTNGCAVWYGWDFDEDGVADQEGSAAFCVTNAYLSAGTYAVSLFVSNSLGETAIRSRSEAVKALVSYPPVNFSIRAVALTNQVYLRWSHPRVAGISNSLVRLRYDTNNYPTSESDGVLLGITTNQFFVHTNLMTGIPYYYTIWATHDGEIFFEPE